MAQCSIDEALSTPTNETHHRRRRTVSCVEKHTFLKYLLTQKKSQLLFLSLAFCHNANIRQSFGTTQEVLDNKLVLHYRRCAAAV